MDQLRSYLRTREAWFRKHPINDAHVKLYQKLRLKLLNEAKRQQETWTCPKCQTTIRTLDRHRDNSGRLSRHCGCAVSPTRSMTPEQLAEHKRQVVIELKRKYRREAGARLRVDMQADAQAKREAAELRRAQRLAAALHDAHVKRYSDLLRARAYVAKQYVKNPQKYRDYQSKRKQDLVDSYVIYNLRVTGVPRTLITPRLIELKREAMEYHRISRSLKTAIKTNWKENNETITKHP